MDENPELCFGSMLSFIADTLTKQLHFHEVVEEVKRDQTAAINEIEFPSY